MIDTISAVTKNASPATICASGRSDKHDAKTRHVLCASHSMTEIDSTGRGSGRSRGVAALFTCIAGQSPRLARLSRPFMGSVDDTCDSAMAESFIRRTHVVTALPGRGAHLPERPIAISDLGKYRFSARLARVVSRMSENSRFSGAFAHTCFAAHGISRMSGVFVVHVPSPRGTRSI